jgi:ribose 5-phosphate isomerase A
MQTEQLKRQAAEQAVEFIQSGMVVGLGHGSTAIFAVRRLAQLLTEGRLTGIIGVPCSRQIEAEARALGIPVSTLDDQAVVDITIDGADEVDLKLDVIKGGGGALLREKMVAQASRREIIVIDEGKLSGTLGTHWAVPIEVVEFGWRSHVRFLQSLGGEAVLRLAEEGTPFHTDQGNLILDTRFGPIEDCGALARSLESRSGIVEHGLFLGLVTDVIVAGADGLRHFSRLG